MGVITIKKITPITIGEIKLPSKIPNLNQILFKGFKTGEFNNPKIKKIIAGIIVKILILPPLSSGYKEIIINKTKNKIPKLLFEENFILSVSIAANS